MKLLITGGSGFLGSTLARHFRNAGHDVAVLLQRGSSTRRIEGLDLEIGRCGTDDELVDFVRKVHPQTVIHTACAYGRQGESLLQLIDANIRLGGALLQALHGLPMGRGPRLFLNTGTSLSAEVSPYALSKQQFSQWGRHQASAAPSALCFVNVRLEHMYGPGDDLTKFPTHVLHACHRNEPQLKLTAGEQIRDFIYIDDVVSAYSTLLEQAHTFGPTVDIEVGSGQPLRVRDFVEAVHTLTASRTELQFGAVPYRANEAMYCVADIERIRGLGWRPAYDLRRGLKRMIELEF